MASSIIGGLVTSGVPAIQIGASDPSTESLNRLSDQHGIVAYASNEEACIDADIIILAVKPQVMADVTRSIAGHVKADALVISIAAGISIQSLQSWLAHERLIRSMPNTPALVKQGVTGLFATASVSEAQRASASTIFSSVGFSFWVKNEGDIDSVTALSGSGPAYFFRFMELMTESGITLGLDPKLAEQAAIQTCYGAAKLALESSDSISVLRQKVTSPGGTTERALQRFETEKLAETVDSAMQDCAKRAQELSNELGTSN